MIEELTFRFERDVTEFPNRLAITAVDDTGERQLDEWYETGVSVAMVEQPLFSAGSVLEGEQTNLLKCGLSGRWIVAIPAENEAVELDVRDVADDSSYLDEPLPIDKDTLVEALIEFAESYRKKRAESDPDPCALTRLDVGIADARRRLEYYRDNWSQDGYQPTIDREHLETFLLECRGRDQLREFVAETGEIAPFVRHLLDNDDGEYVETMYRQLFNREYDTIAREGLEVLREHPDERASVYIVGVALESNPTFAVPALEILSQVDHEILIDIVRERVRADDPVIARAAIDALASLDPESLDPNERDRVVSHFQYGREATEDEALESRIDEALSQLE